MKKNVTLEQDTIYQYLDGWDFLSAAILERNQLLRELEHLAKAHQGNESTKSIIDFPLVSAQALLFELSIIAETIDTLIVEINNYAERCGRSRVQVTETIQQ